MTTLLKNKYFYSIALVMGVSLVLLVFVNTLELSHSVKNGISLGVGVALFNALVSFVALNWSYRKSDKIFFSTFFGSMVWKLVVLGVLFYCLLGQGLFHPAVSLISLALMTFI